MLIAHKRALAINSPIPPWRGALRQSKIAYSVGLKLRPRNIRYFLFSFNRYKTLTSVLPNRFRLQSVINRTIFMLYNVILYINSYLITRRRSGIVSAVGFLTHALFLYFVRIFLLVLYFINCCFDFYDLTNCTLLLFIRLCVYNLWYNLVFRI